MRLGLALLCATAVAVPALHAQTRKAAPTRIEAEVKCASELGVGVATKRRFCDVLTGANPKEGILVTIPPHRGPVTIGFELHNRHTYSAELVKLKQAYRKYTATIGVLTMDNTLVSRAVIQSEFRNAKDLFDRIAGGTGPGGVKAVAPTGSQSIVITIPAEESSVSILGEKLIEERVDNTDPFTASGRPVAVISNVMIEYRPGPPPRTPARRR